MAATGTPDGWAKVGGWQGYNSLVVSGDLTGDGVADLLARDTAGVLWRYSGDGKGSLVTPSPPRLRLADVHHPPLILPPPPRGAGHYDPDTP